jgi:hypothetical protein
MLFPKTQQYQDKHSHKIKYQEVMSVSEFTSEEPNEFRNHTLFKFLIKTSVFHAENCFIAFNLKSRNNVKIDKTNSIEVWMGENFEHKVYETIFNDYEDSASSEFKEPVIVTFNTENLPNVLIKIMYNGPKLDLYLENVVFRINQATF